MIHLNLLTTNSDFYEQFKKNSNEIKNLPVAFRNSIFILEHIRKCQCQ